jgi:hypothetical protein
MEPHYIWKFSPKYGPDDKRERIKHVTFNLKINDVERHISKQSIVFVPTVTEFVA